ncbi:MAG: hypothetical protein IJE97_09055 [Thermoguttaceae bacterium]|nr:hypothetical protein [Thermoguttaceae bacterium]MBQ2849402.1 hypothetical protein [Thermoguttaceae bacterium]
MFSDVKIGLSANRWPRCRSRRRGNFKRLTVWPRWRRCNFKAFAISASRRVGRDVCRVRNFKAFAVLAELAPLQL